jgi:hypothetical protein
MAVTIGAMAGIIEAMLAWRAVPYAGPSWSARLSAGAVTKWSMPTVESSLDAINGVSQIGPMRKQLERRAAPERRSK